MMLGAVLKLFRLAITEIRLRVKSLEQVGAGTSRIFRMTIKQLNTQPDLKVLTKAEVISLTGLSKDTIERLVSQGEGPPCVQLSQRRRGFTVGGLKAWLRSRTVNSGNAA
jgi:predicted DNA-binding transcriptional regulator AlpA